MISKHVSTISSNQNQSKDPASKGKKRKRDESATCPPKDNEPNSLLNDSISKKNVYTFLRRCLMHILSYEDKVDKKKDTSCPLLGGKENSVETIKKFKKMISGLKYDGFILNQLLQNVKLSRIKYLAPIKCDKFKTLIFLSVLKWLFEDVGFMILKAHFYITDTSKTNSDLFFYMKKTWKAIVFAQLTDPSTKNYKKLYNLEKIKEADAVNYCSTYQSNGVCLGRLLPKNVNNECRVISGCRLYNPCTKKTYSMNYKFITLNNCLNWLIQSDKSLTGFACSNQRDMLKGYSRFLSLNFLNRNYGIDGSNEQLTLKKWNFMKFDIEKCFDTIDSNLIMDYVNQLFYQRLGNDYVFTMIRHVKVKFDLDHKQLKTKYEYLTLKHHYHEKGFLHGIADFIRLIEYNEKRRPQNLAKPSYKHKDELIYVPW